jgi:hypothetical protein
MLTQKLLEPDEWNDGIKEGEPGALSYLVTASWVFHLLKHCLKRAIVDEDPDKNKFTRTLHLVSKHRLGLILVARLSDATAISNFSLLKLDFCEAKEGSAIAPR